jgi:two-component system, NarL family, response regulator NreC
VNIIRILLADDHALLREGMRMLIHQQEDMQVVGEAEEGLEAVRKAIELKPSVVVMDISMPGMDGAKATARLKEVMPETRVIALTRHADQATLQQLLRAGATGYVVKRAAAQELIQAIRVVANGATYIDTALASRVVGGMLASRTIKPGATAQSLSPREEQVLRLIAWGHSNAEVATQIGISVKTVEYQKARAMEKLALSSRVDIVQHALREGWLERS